MGITQNLLHKPYFQQAATLHEPGVFWPLKGLSSYLTPLFQIPDTVHVLTLPDFTTSPSSLLLFSLLHLRMRAELAST